MAEKIDPQVLMEIANTLGIPVIDLISIASTNPEHFAALAAKAGVGPEDATRSTSSLGEELAGTETLPPPVPAAPLAVDDATPPVVVPPGPATFNNVNRAAMGDKLAMVPPLSFGPTATPQQTLNAGQVQPGLSAPPYGSDASMVEPAPDPNDILAPEGEAVSGEGGEAAGVDGQEIARVLGDLSGVQAPDAPPTLAPPAPPRPEQIQPTDLLAMLMKLQGNPTIRSLGG